MKPTWLISAVLAGLFALTGSAMPAQDHSRDVRHRVLHKFDARDREAARKWYNEHRENLPEGFRDEHPLRPEDASRLRAGAALDSDTRKKIRPVPVDLLRRLPPPPRHYRYAVLDERILLVDKTWNISDIIDLHGDEGRPG